MDAKKFNKLAIEIYGDKLVEAPVKPTQEQVDKLNEEKSSVFTILDFEQQTEGTLWVRDKNKCVQCGSDLGGLFGSFEWGIVNGHGICGKCETSYQYYHRIRDFEGNQHIIYGYALVGIPKKIVNKHNKKKE